MFEMKYPVYSYRDNKVGFGTPMVDQNDNSAIRGFSYAINHHDGVMAFAPSDFDLYKIGEFDSHSGQLIPSTPVLLVSGSSVFGAK